MMTESGPDNPDKPDKGDPVIEHFVALRKYIESSHDGLSKRLEKVEAGLSSVDGRVSKVEVGLQRLERKVDAGFDQVGRKLDGLAPARRAAPRRRKR